MTIIGNGYDIHTIVIMKLVKIKIVFISKSVFFISFYNYGVQPRSLKIF